MNQHPPHARPTPSTFPMSMTSTVDIHTDQLAALESRFSPSRRSSAVSTSSSSTSNLRRASISSISLMMPSRLPLAPLGPQITPAFALADAQSPLQSTVTKSLSNSRQQSLSDDLSLLLPRLPRHVTITGVIYPHFFLPVSVFSIFELWHSSTAGLGLTSDYDSR